MDEIIPEEEKEPKNNCCGCLNPQQLFFGIYTLD
jgi:hypothetical protein